MAWLSSTEVFECSYVRVFKEGTIWTTATISRGYTDSYVRHQSPDCCGSMITSK